MAEEGKAAKRLCSEIQLFDLCDKDGCSDKDGRFCTHEEMLSRFEAITEEDTRSPDQYAADELEDVEGDELVDDEFGVDEYGEEDEGDE